MKTMISAPARKLVMILQSVGNPDYAQYAPVSEPKPVKGATLAAMVKAAEDYRAENDLGGGNWVDPEIRENGKPIATISYNGRVWAMDGTEITALKG